MAEPTILRLDDPSDSLKMLRETLSAVQNGAAGISKPIHAARIGRIIAEIDRQRPLGPDGKHGSRHTPTCGCEQTYVDPTPWICSHGLRAPHAGAFSDGNCSVEYQPRTHAPTDAEEQTPRHFIPYGSYIAPCGYIEDKRYPEQQTELRRETTCPGCQAHMTDLGDLPPTVTDGEQ